MITSVEFLTKILEVLSNGRFDWHTREPIPGHQTFEVYGNWGELHKLFFLIDCRLNPELVCGIVGGKRIFGDKIRIPLS